MQQNTTKRYSGRRKWLDCASTSLDWMLTGDGFVSGRIGYDGSA